jgi:RNA polymerase sigma factor, sigma-70 family
MYRKRILMTLRVNKKFRNNVSLSEPVGTDKEGNELTFIDLIAEDEDSVITDVENRMLVDKVLELIEAVLDSREYKIICLRYGLNNTPALTQREVADRFGISRSYISRIEKKAIQKIRTAVRDNDIVF